jgi:hypothetical protein
MAPQFLNNSADLWTGTRPEDNPERSKDTNLEQRIVDKILQREARAAAVLQGAIVCCANTMCVTLSTAQHKNPDQLFENYLMQDQRHPGVVADPPPVLPSAKALRRALIWVPQRRNGADVPMLSLLSRICTTLTAAALLPTAAAAATVDAHSPRAHRV